MDPKRFYRLTKPSTWKEAPGLFSYSSLGVLEGCPLRWQLMNSTYEDLPRYPARPREAAEVGSIVHGALEKLFRGLARYGLPPLGSKEFRDALREIDVMSYIRERLLEHEREVALHPRAAGYRLRATAREVYNKTSLLFQAEYKRAQQHPIPRASARGARVMQEGEEVESPLQFLRSCGVLAELRLKHPELPFQGVIDLVADDNGKTRILDFKSGQEKPEHQEQLELYGLLWWRATGEVPASLEVRYPGSLKEYPVSEARLLEVEAELKARILSLLEELKSPPAKARPGAHCQYCDVRQFCPAYWNSLPSLSTAAALQGRESWVDLELVVAQEPTAYGFVGKTRHGEEVAVVFDEGGAALHGPFQRGETVRVLGGKFSLERRELLLSRSAEVFHQG